MYNVGFFIPKIDDSDLNVEIFNALNDSLKSDKISEGIVLYNDVDKNPVVPEFGMFNSTDVWFFTGILISTTLDTCDLSRSAVNKFRLFHLFNPDEKNLVGLLHISKDVEFITRSPEDTKELHRLTGIKPVLEISSVVNLIERLEEL